MKERRIHSIVVVTWALGQLAVMMNVAILTVSCFDLEAAGYLRIQKRDVKK